MTKYYCSMCGNAIDNEIESFICDVLDDNGKIKDYTAFCPKCMERIENNGN